MRRLSESEDVSADGIEVEPIDVNSTDEIGEVARAFDQVHREALQLAANEAALRGNVNAMFVNLSRRSQSLVERQIRLIDDLEQGEQDAERLSNLFQMDHLATRMRRNSENLLVLAGHDLSRRWNQPVALVDVLRAAVSEIEEYERVSLNVQPGIAVRGQAVNDVVHLLAELAENATSLSSADTPVNISGHLLTSGGVLLDITDQGVGMGAEEMAHANWRLDNPPVVDVAVSRRMGLFVVGRLAARHGIRVRLRPASSGGLTALVWLPDEVITHSATVAPGLTGFDTAESGPGELEAELAGLGGGEWVDPDRSTAEQEVSAARTPKFASLRADSEETPLGPRRVPGAALRPGASWSTTGPMSVFEPGAPGDGRTEESSDAGPLPAGTSNGAATVGQEPMLGGEPGRDEPTATRGGSPAHGRSQARATSRSGRFRGQLLVAGESRSALSRGQLPVARSRSGPLRVQLLVVAGSLSVRFRGRPSAAAASPSDRVRRRMLAVAGPSGPGADRRQYASQWRERGRRTGRQPDGCSVLLQLGNRSGQRRGDRPARREPRGGEPAAHLRGGRVRLVPARAERSGLVR